MKNIQTPKERKHKHAVIVCSVIGKKGTPLLPNEVKFKLGDKVFFIPEGTHEVKRGVVVRIMADIAKFKTGTKPHVDYTIKDASTKYDVPYYNVYSEFNDAKLKAEGLCKFEFVIYFNDTCFFDKIYAKKYEDAYDALQKKYPKANDIEYIID